MYLFEYSRNNRGLTIDNTKNQDKIEYLMLGTAPNNSGIAILFYHAGF